MLPAFILFQEVRADEALFIHELKNVQLQKLVTKLSPQRSIGIIK